MKMVRSAAAFRIKRRNALRRPVRKTDYGTVFFHWTLVVLLVISVGTGLRIAIDSASELHWLRQFDMILPQHIVWTAHIPIGTALFALALSYAIYVADAGLFRRINPSLGRIKGIFGSTKARYGAINIILLWSLFLSLVTQLVTGTMLYIGYGGLAARAHLFVTWVIIGYVPCHVTIHYLIGGRSQLLRIFNPTTKLPQPPAPFDPYNLIAARMYAAGPAPLSPKPLSPKQRAASAAKRRVRTMMSQKPRRNRYARRSETGR